MDKRLVRYFLAPQPGERFPTFLMEVEQGSAEEVEFLRDAKARGAASRIFKRTQFLCGNKEIDRHSYFHLLAKSDRAYRTKAFMDFNDVCFQDEMFTCWTGLKQTRKMMLDPEKSNQRFDVMLSPHPPHPIIVTRRFKELLELTGITGFTTVPCLHRGRTYTDEEFDFSTYNQSLAEQATHYQMIVTAKARGIPRVGNVQIVRQCPCCHTVYDFYSDIETSSEGYFLPDDLNDTDLQFFDGFVSNNFGEFKVFPAPRVLISSKLLRLMVEHRIKGLEKHRLPPNPPHRYVEIRANGN